ncbi:MAG: hypothetical protein AB8B57_07105 [Congregibacter sp.]
MQDDGERAPFPTPRTLEKDAEIGQDLYRNLARLIDRLAKRHGITRDTATDYLLAGALFTAADQRNLCIADTVELMQCIAVSVQNDELDEDVRH